MYTSSFSSHPQNRLTPYADLPQFPWVAAEKGRVFLQTGYQAAGCELIRRLRHTRHVLGAGGYARALPPPRALARSQRCQWSTYVTFASICAIVPFIRTIRHFAIPIVRDGRRRRRRFH